MTPAEQELNCRIGRILAGHRHRAGFIQAEAALALNLSKRQYARLETGETQWAVTDVLTLGALLGQPLLSILQERLSEPPIQTAEPIVNEEDTDVVSPRSTTCL